jgi:hypothetical protein
MRVLVYENNETDLALLIHHLHTSQLGIHIDSTHDLNLAFMHYDLYTYDAVLFNIDSFENRTLLNLMLSDKKIPKIIAITESVDCSNVASCDFCKNDNYHLLVKPVYTNDLIFLLFGQTQRTSYCASAKLKQLKMIDKEIENFNLCIEQGMFINKNSYLKRQEMLNHIVEKLCASNINYKIDSTQNIHIL